MPPGKRSGEREAAAPARAKKPGASGRGRARRAAERRSPQGDRARNRLIERYHGYVSLIVARLVRTMRFPAALRDEFMSAGYLGLVEAASRFDPARGHDFRAFAFLRIRGAVIDYIRSSCELSGNTYRVFKALEAAQELRAESLEHQQTGSTGREERAAKSLTALSKSLVAYRLTALKHGMVTIGAASPDDPERCLEEKQGSEKIRAIVATLPEKERTIIEQYYFHDRKLTDVAAQYAGLSKSWVSRLHDRALVFLKEKFQQEAPELLEP